MHFHISRQDSSDFEVKHIAFSMVNTFQYCTLLSKEKQQNRISVFLAATGSPPLTSCDLTEISEQNHSFQTFELSICVTAIPKQSNTDSDMHLYTYPTVKVRCFYCQCPIVYWQSIHSKQTTYRQNFTKSGFQQKTTV